MCVCEREYVRLCVCQCACEGQIFFFFFFRELCLSSPHIFWWSNPGCQAWHQVPSSVEHSQWVHVLLSHMQICKLYYFQMQELDLFHFMFSLMFAEKLCLVATDTAFPEVKGIHTYYSLYLDYSAKSMCQKFGPWKWLLHDLTEVGVE